MKIYSINKSEIGEDWRIEITDDSIRINYVNRKDSYWSSKYTTLATKEKPTRNILFWNYDDRELINYLIRNKIGKYETRVEDNYDRDPCNRLVKRGTRTWYMFNFEKCFN